METLPEDIRFEIMQLLPLKSVHKCACVSKVWKNITHRYLMNLPRLLFAFYPRSLDLAPDLLLHSVYQKKENDMWLSSGQQQTRISSEHEYAIYSGPLRGLVCLQSYTEVVLCNPNTKQLLTLPDREAHERFSNEKCFLGYDEVTDALKVLLSVSVFGDNTMQMHNQVLTVGPGELHWRPIECEHPYLVVTNGLCIGGILYYGSWFRGQRPAGPKSLEIPIVMSFNIRSEEFTVIELPEGVEVLPHDTKMVNYHGKVALVTGSGKDLSDNGEFQLCVRDEIEETWRVERVVIPCWRDTVGCTLFSFQGTIGTGELIFSKQL